jgi:hypothetical protein
VAFLGWSAEKQQYAEKVVPLGEIEEPYVE